MSAMTLTGRGDLLRWMRRCATLEEKCVTAPLLGFEYKAPTEDKERGREPITDGTTAPPPKPPPYPMSADQKRPPEFFYALKQREIYASPSASQDNLPLGLQGVEPLQDADLQPVAEADPLPWQPILPLPRQKQFLRETLVSAFGQRLDIPRLIKRMARLQLFSRLPRKPHLLPAGRVYVLLDCSNRLLPFWQDGAALCAQIARRNGRSGLDIRVLDGNPHGPYWDWFDPRQRLQPWQRLQTPSVVLIIGDLGQLAAADSGIRQHWLHFVDGLRRQGIQPVALTPLSPAQQAQECWQTVHQVLWNKHSRLKPVRPDADIDGHRIAVKRVLGLLSVAAHVEPELLRAILGLLPVGQADSGVEAAVYLHDDVHWGYTAISVRPEKRADYQFLFKQEPAALQRQVLALLKRHHGSQFPGVWAEDVLNAAPWVNFTLDELTADLQQAETFMQRFTRSFAGTQTQAGMAQYARRHLQRLGEETRTQYRNAYTSALYGLAHREQLRAGAEVPAEYDPSVVQSSVRVRTGSKKWLLAQYGETLYLIDHVESGAELATGVILAEFDTPYDTLLLMRTCPNDPNADRFHMSLSLNDKSQEKIIICKLQGQMLVLDTGLERLTITACTKPSWARQIIRDANGLQAILVFAGKTIPFDWVPRLISGNVTVTAEPWQVISGKVLLDTLFNDSKALLEKFDERLVRQLAYRALSQEPSHFAVNFDQFGLYLDLAILGAIQRFRWIEPGSFWMGSPGDEPEREWLGLAEGKGSETLHFVTLTQGFWLADTTVTQAFWLAVMGNNPSKFEENPENPVERVSWDDAQQFMSRLNALFPDLQASLPSEAQWEYACRAGTSTPFAFGANITPAQVNYHGDHPYPGGEPGLYRRQTVSVKSLPPNPWGLYEMHGNVLEWCADVWRHTISTMPAINPRDAENNQGNALRVLRGGSWGYYAARARSADRAGMNPAVRTEFIGFRLALSHHAQPSAHLGIGTAQQVSVTDPGLDSPVAEQLEMTPTLPQHPADWLVKVKI